MAEILIRGLSPETIHRLKKRGRRNGRSLQAEARQILEQAADAENIANLLQKYDEKFAGRRFSASTKMIREDRRR
jgi:plasmid stability protein